MTNNHLKITGLTTVATGAAFAGSTVSAALGATMGMQGITQALMAQALGNQSGDFGNFTGMHMTDPHAPLGNPLPGAPAKPSGKTPIPGN